MFDAVYKAIGNTPLAKINFTSQGQFYAKLEYTNPGGSIKDRSALYMIEQAEQRGILKPGGTIIDASSGNHGIAVAMIGRAKGYNVIITVSEKSSSEKVETIRAYGAQVITCPSTEFIEDPRSYHSQAVKLLQEIPNSFMPNQYFNIDNAEGHYQSLGPEIWRQTNGKVTHLFAGAGTGGTISGAGKYLKEQNPDIKLIAVDSINSFKSTGGNPKPYKVEGMGLDFISPVFNEPIIDVIHPVTDEDALGMLPVLAQQQGLLVGPSSGAVAAAAAAYAPLLKPNDVAVLIFGDSGRAYLSKGFFTTTDQTRHAQLASVFHNTCHQPPKSLLSNE